MTPSIVSVTSEKLQHPVIDPVIPSSAMLKNLLDDIIFYIYFFL